MDTQIAALKTEIAELQLRLTRVEGRARIALTMAALLAGLGTALGPAQPVESQGVAAMRGQKVRAPFTVVDGRGRPVFQVKAAGPVHSAAVYDTNGQIISLVTDVDGARGLDVRDANGVKVIGMGTLETADGQLRGLDIYGMQHEHLLSLDVGSSSEHKGFHVIDPNGTKVASLVSSPEGTGSVKLTDRNGAVLFRQP